LAIGQQLAQKNIGTGCLFNFADKGINEYSNWVNFTLHTEFQFSQLPGSALKVCVVGDSSGWAVVVVC
jgi:hypothetical protein